MGIFLELAIELTSSSWKNQTSPSNSRGDFLIFGTRHRIHEVIFSLLELAIAITRSSNPQIPAQKIGREIQINITRGLIWPSWVLKKSELAIALMRPEKIP